DNAGNYSGFSSVTLTTAKDNKAPSAPSNLKYEQNDTTIALEWKASKDDVKLKCYYVYKNGIKIAETTKLEKSVKVSSGVGVYVFIIKAADLAGNVSECSNSVVVVTV
ncbi:MAG: hypothetical protein HGA22_02470, partial [Clostridiales bacterium]|nr:hypothetical protein [Clostridiales bacterium]